MFLQAEQMKKEGFFLVKYLKSSLWSAIKVKSWVKTTIRDIVPSTQKSENSFGEKTKQNLKYNPRTIYLRMLHFRK